MLGVCWQMLTRRNGCLLAVTPDKIIDEFAFGAEGVDVQ